MERLLEISLEGARVGRRTGFNAGKMRAATLVLEHVKDVDTALRLAKLIRELEDSVK
jgi:hypothetical protein